MISADRNVRPRFHKAGITDPSYRKKPHPIPHRRAFYTRMKKNNGLVSHGRSVMDYAIAAMEQMELYCQAHPGSPAAVRRPRLFVRGDLWVALLGPSVEEGIVGIGPTVTDALRAFDAQYPGRAAPASSSHRELSNSAKRVLCDRMISSRKMECESPQQFCHNRCYIVTRTKGE